MHVPVTRRGARRGLHRRLRDMGRNLRRGPSSIPLDPAEGPRDQVGRRFGRGQFPEQPQYPFDALHALQKLPIPRSAEALRRPGLGRAFRVMLQKQVNGATIVAAEFHLHVNPGKCAGRRSVSS